MMEMVASRMRRWAKLKADPAVRAALKRWFDAVDKDHSGCISKDEYVAINRRMYRCLAGASDAQNEGKAHALAEADWDVDSLVEKGGSMGKEKFLEIIFEVADVWTVSDDPRRDISR